MQWAYAKAGVQLPRVTDAQFAAGNGKPVDRDKLLPGDLVFFGKPGNIYHVGISMGGDKFLHAPKTGDVVKVASLSDSYFSQNFAGGRRFDEASGAAGAAAVPAAPVAGAAATPPIDPKAVAEAQAAVARDAAEVNRANSGLFMAVKAQEERRHKTVQFMKAIDPNEAKAAAAPAAAPPAAAAAAAAAAPAAAASPPPRPVDAGEPIQLPDDISDDYPGNNASKDELAKWLAKQADKHGLPPELPVMASLVESGVKNLNFGDADSVGFFQMRVGIWNQGAYKGYPEHPELQAKWFIDQALAVKKQAIARGDADFGKDPSKWGEWIADIERPAEQYRGRYQLRLKEARGLLVLTRGGLAVLAAARVGLFGLGVRCAGVARLRFVARGRRGARAARRLGSCCSSRGAASCCPSTEPGRRVVRRARRLLLLGGRLALGLERRQRAADLDAGHRRRGRHVDALRLHAGAGGLGLRSAGLGHAERGRERGDDGHEADGD